MQRTATVRDSRAPELLELQYALSCRLARSSGLDETLRLCLAGAMQAAGLECGGIYLVEPDGGVRLAHHDGLGEAFVLQAHHHGPGSPQAEFVRAGQPLYTNVQLLGSDGIACLLAGFEALAIVPVWADGEVVGCLNLASARVSAVADQARIALEPLAQQIGQAIVRERTLTALRGSESSLNAFFDSVSDFLFVLDDQGTILRANATVYRQLGWSADELVGQSVLVVHPPERRDDVVAVVGEMVAGRREQCDIPLQARDGTWIPVETRVTRGTWTGKPAYFGVSRGIGDRLAAEQAHRWASLSVLTGGIAHDFNNILLLILGNADLLRDDLDGLGVAVPTATADRLQGIANAVQRAGKLCHQMLAYSGRGQLSPRRVDCGRLVRETVARSIAHGRDGVVISVAVQPDLPAVEADEEQLDHAVDHLVQNALESFGASGGQISVRVWGEPTPPSRVAISVADDGCGMDDETRARMFEPFYSTKFVGRGLGAAAVQGIVAAHGGEVRVDSRPGQGTTVTLTLPALMSAASCEASSGPPAGAGAARHVLLVDDEDAVRGIGKALIERLGLPVITAGDGREAIAKHEEHRERIAMVILDLTMPDLDGAATLTALRAAGLRAPAVIASGMATTTVQVRCEECPPDGYLRKPFSMQDLEACLARFVEMPRPACEPVGC